MKPNDGQLSGSGVKQSVNFDADKLRTQITLESQVRESPLFNWLMVLE